MGGVLTVDVRMSASRLSIHTRAGPYGAIETPGINAKPSIPYVTIYLNPPSDQRMQQRSISRSGNLFRRDGP
jgi:hypothetical protein